MRVLFVYSLRDALSLKRPLAGFGDIHIGISYLSASLKARHHSTRVVVLSSEYPGRSYRLLEAAIRDFEPHMVAFTAVSTQYPFIRAAAERVKEYCPSAYRVVGGVHASLVPEEVVNDGFNAVCVGEGESALVELAELLETGVEPERIANLWIKTRHGSIAKNPARHFNSGLGTLPFADREIWSESVRGREGGDQVVMPSRGCPYNCTYCSNHALRKLAPGKYVRLRPVDDILAELRHLKHTFPAARRVYLQSETIAVNLPWLEELTRQIGDFNGELDKPISFTTNFRVARAFLREEVFAALKRANVTAIEIGLESGSERLRRQVLKRAYSNEDFLRAVTLARRHGMEVNVYNMIGLPGETQADYWETVELNRRAAPDHVMTSIFHPYPGTDLYETCEEQRLLPPNMTAERFRAAIDYPQFSRRDIQRGFDWFDFRIYKGKRSLQYRLRRTLRNKAYSKPWVHAVFVRLLPLWHALREKN